MKNILCLTTILMSGCITGLPADLDNGVDLSYQSRFEKEAGNHYASVAKVSIVNQSKFALCVLEDVFLNELSPFVTVEKLGRRAVSSGIPNPPKSNEILRIEPGEKKTFERIIDYRGQGRALAGEYVVSVELSFCKDGKRFTESVTIS